MTGQTGPDILPDILVVGGGPAGASAALAAARQGTEVWLIEKRPAIGHRPHCAEFIPLALALETDMPSEIAVQSVTGMETMVGNRSVFTQSPGLMIDRPRFDAHLAKSAAEAGARIMLDCRLIEMDEQGVMVRTPEGIRRFGPKAIIAADGAASSLGRMLGLEPLKRLTGVQVRVPLIARLEKTLVFFDPVWRHGYAWLFPKNDQANLGLGMHETAPGDARRSLTRLMTDLARQGLVDSRILYESVGAIPISGPRPRLVLPGPCCPSLLAGDAAGLTHPVTGAGVPQAVISGREAGLAAARYLRSGNRDDLVSYEQNILARYGQSLVRAVSKRAVIEQEWDAPEFSQLIERTWPAFKAWRRD